MLLLFNVWLCLSNTLIMCALFVLPDKVRNSWSPFRSRIDRTSFHPWSQRKKTQTQANEFSLKKTFIELIISSAKFYDNWSLIDMKATLTSNLFPPSLWRQSRGSVEWGAQPSPWRLSVGVGLPLVGRDGEGEGADGEALRAAPRTPHILWGPTKSIRQSRQSMCAHHSS